ncbi:MAG: ATP-binding cassette domain-containing protein, partial [Planctomycetota bacterium]
MSFAVQSGETYALLGGNGAGKSTTLLTFLGFLRPDSGAARVLGRRVETDIAAARRAIAYLPESAALYDHLDARENLQYLLDLGGSRARGADIERALDEVALPDAARSRRLAEHSKGMRQKVALALALLRDSEVLLLDESTSGLDPLAIDEFHALVRRLAAD